MSCTFFKDLVYFFLKANLSGRIEKVLNHKNPSLSKRQKDNYSDRKNASEREFWLRVTLENIVRITLAYLTDMQMLGYSAVIYLKSLEVTVPQELYNIEKSLII